MLQHRITCLNCGQYTTLGGYMPGELSYEQVLQMAVHNPGCDVVFPNLNVEVVRHPETNEVVLKTYELSRKTTLGPKGRDVK